MQFAHFMLFGQQQKWLPLCFKDQMMLNFIDLFCLCSSWTETLTTHTVVILQLGSMKETRGEGRPKPTSCDCILTTLILMPFYFFESKPGAPQHQCGQWWLWGAARHHPTLLPCARPQQQQATGHPAWPEGPEPASQGALGYDEVQARAEAQGRGAEQRRGHHTAFPLPLAGEGRQGLATGSAWINGNEPCCV